MAKQKVEKEPVPEIDFDAVYAAIKEPEEIKLGAIFRIMGYSPPAKASELSRKRTLYPYHELYSQYKAWLAKNNIDHWVFRH